MKNLYILIAITLLFISCNEDDSPTQNNSVQGFLKGKVISNNNFDLLDSTFENINVYLIKSGSIIDSTLTDIEGNYLFEGVDEGVYSIKAKKTTYFENQIENIQFVGKDTLKLNTFKILHPVSGIKIMQFVEPTWSKANGLEYSYLNFGIIINIKRLNLKAIYSVSRTNVFDSISCIKYNRIINTDFIRERNSIGTGLELLNLNINSGDKLYFKITPLQNGVEHSQNSKELGEPVYFEVVAP
jgi:hypothetical protein